MNYIRLLARSICPARQITSLTQRALIVAAFAFFALDFGSAFVGASVAKAQEGQSLAAAQVDPATLGAISPEQDPNQRPGFGDVLFKMLPMFFMVFFIFYFMVIKPQQQKLKSQQDLLQSLKKGDSVVTTGGIIAKVAAIESDHVMLDIAPNVRLKLEPSHVAKRFEKNPQEKDKAAA